MPGMGVVFIGSNVKCNEKYGRLKLIVCFASTRAFNFLARCGKKHTIFCSRNKTKQCHLVIHIPTIGLINIFGIIDQKFKIRNYVGAF